jgi:cation:H+ antiporter
MLAALGLLALGTGLLYAGAESAIRGASAAARALRVPAFVLGALLFGIDLEGLGTAVGASAAGQPLLAAGEIFGSVLVVFSLAFGAALLVSRRPLEAPDVRMVLAPAIPLLAAGMVLTDRYVDRLEGALLLGIYAGYIAAVVQEGRLARERAAQHEAEADEAPRSSRRAIARAVGGLLLLSVGAGLAVAGATRFVAQAGLSEGFVGAAVLGLLVSLDEILLEVLPARRGAPDLAIGNLLGTLAAFCSGVLGVAALVRPLDVDSAAALAFLGAAFLYTVVATAFLARGKAGRGVGLFVLAFYAAWLVTAAEI